jgi:hypothetical protein
MADWASTERIQAELDLAEHVRLLGELHVQARVGHHDGPETPLEMLNRPEPFFPVTLQGGEIAFTAKSQVSVVTCGPAIGISDPDRAGAAKTIGLEVTMASGEEFRGWAALELPPTKARTLDYLNAPGRFFTLLSEEATRYINRRYVRLVRPLD